MVEYKTITGKRVKHENTRDSFVLDQFIFFLTYITVIYIIVL
jgi:hypothetical protein